MTREEQTPSSEDMRKVSRVMQIRMRNNAMHHFNRIGARTLRILQELDLFDDEDAAVVVLAPDVYAQKPEDAERANTVALAIWPEEADAT